ncbi:hypothetical protein QKC54_gp0142 [Megavirus baoshan]|uniref:Uncharacterized protein n=1 Tax=Megavirus baoshan TaxID=2496520 RepID=A0A3S5HLE9_9VIRU|nr:hypothetical protein QKC54_gp0142 [Megavirus baoshan]AZL89774.1 hypothetical protein Mb0930 [Megavirus baoshan]
MEHIQVKIDYREDYNGRPICIDCDNNVILRTHPFYCWSSNKYGRVYRYDIIDRKSKSLRDDFIMYCYDSASIIIDDHTENFFDQILDFDNLGNEKTFTYNGFSFQITKTSEFDVDTLIDKMENGYNLDENNEDNKIINSNSYDRANICLIFCILNCNKSTTTEPDNFYGFFEIPNGIYIITGSFDCTREYIYKSNNYKSIKPKITSYCESEYSGLIDVYFSVD